MILAPGRPAPRQSTPTTCGSACLVVARALADPAFSRWLQTGDGGGRTGLLPGDTAADRFAAYEALVKRRTTGPLGLGGPQLPWPAALGTPPWTALAELAAATGARTGDHEVCVLRWDAASDREAALEQAAERLTPGRSALVYVGSRWLPRHVVLLSRPEPGEAPVVYEPSAGEVLPLDTRALATGAARLGGWPEPWLIVAPTDRPSAPAARPVDGRR